MRNRNFFFVLGLIIVAAIAFTFIFTKDANATWGHGKRSVCHPVNGHGQTGTGWNIIKPAQASSHIDEATGAGKHVTQDGRTDVYADEAGKCPVVIIPDEPDPTDTPDPTPTPTPTDEPTPTDTPDPTPTDTPTPTDEPTPTPTEVPTTPVVTPPVTDLPAPGVGTPTTATKPHDIVKTKFKQRKHKLVKVETHADGTVTTTSTPIADVVEEGF